MVGRLPPSERIRAPLAARVTNDFVERPAAKAVNLPVGDPGRDEVALGPLIDAGQCDKVHGLVSSTVDAGGRLAAGGTYDRLFYPATGARRCRADGAGLHRVDLWTVAPVLKYSTVDEAVRIAADTEYGPF